MKVLILVIIISLGFLVERLVFSFMFICLFGVEVVFELKGSGSAGVVWGWYFTWECCGVEVDGVYFWEFVVCSWCLLVGSERIGRNLWGRSMGGGGEKRV